MARSDVLVSAEWAEQNLNADKTVFIEVDEDTSAYDGGHIPGAIKLDWKQDLQDQGCSGTNRSWVTRWVRTGRPKVPQTVTSRRRRSRTVAAGSRASRSACRRSLNSRSAAPSRSTNIRTPRARRHR